MELEKINELESIEEYYVPFDEPDQTYVIIDSAARLRCRFLRFL